MVTTHVADATLEVRIAGSHKLLAMKNSIQIPLDSIEFVQADAEIARAGPEGTRNPGTSIPGILSAGSFHSGVKRTFWDVHNPDNAIRIKLRNTHSLFAGIEGQYDELVVEVANPAETVAQVNRALFESRRRRDI